MDLSVSSINDSDDKYDTKERLIHEETEFISFQSQTLKQEEYRKDELTNEEINCIGFSNKNYKYEFRYWYVILLTLNASLSYSYVGWNVGVFDSIQINLTKMFIWTKEEEKIYLSFISASLLFGGIIGAIISGYFLKKLGRKNTYIVTNILSWIGTGMTCIINEYCMIAGRFISGICLGLYSTAISIYINEYAPYEISGLCGSLYELIYSLSIFLCYVAGLNLPAEEEPENEWWRFMVIIPAILTVINMLLIIFIFKRETPKYLYITKKDEESARESLRKIYKRESDVDQMIKDYENLSKLQSELRCEDMFSKKYRIRLLIACVLMIGQQVDGADVIFMYSDHIYIQIVGHKKNATVYTLLTGLSGVVAGFFSVFVIERLGRRRLFLLGHTFIVLILAAISLMYFFEFISSFIIYLFIFFTFINGISIGPISYIYASDLLPENGVGISVLFNYLSSYLCTQTFLFLEGSFLKSEGTFGLYGIASGIVLTIGVMYMKETKNKSASQIDKLFS